MKRLICKWLLVIFLVPATAHAASTEGRHYMMLPFPAGVETGDKVEVREFFWYGCPHCYVLEPGLTRWVKKLPSNAQFVRTPAVASSRWAIHGQAYFAFEALDIVNKMHDPFFKSVQNKKNAYNNEKGITEFAVSQGVDRKKFTEAFNSFGVRVKLEKAKQLNLDLNITSVPAVVVDGKYLTSPAMAGGEEKFLKVLDELVRKAAQERKKKAPKS